MVKLSGWVLKRRRIGVLAVSLLLALAISGLGHLLEQQGTLRALVDLTQSFMEALRGINPLQIARVFGDSVTECYQGAATYGSCVAVNEQPVSQAPLWHGVGAVAMWLQEQSPAAQGLAMVSVVVAGALLWKVLDLEHGSTLRFILWVGLTPLAAGGVALLLQLFLLVLAGIFTEVLAGILFLGSALGGLVTAVRSFFETAERAEKIEAHLEKLANRSAQKGPPPVG